MAHSTLHPLDDPAADPFEIAAAAAADIARLSGVERHDIAVTLGSGWGRAAELIGEETAAFPATEVVGFSKPALEGHVGTLRSVRTPGGKNVLVIGAAPTTTKATACDVSSTASAPPRRPVRRR